MDTSEINKLAKDHSDAVFLHGLNKIEIIMLLAAITARVNQSLSVDINTNKVLKTVPTVKPLGAIIANKGYPCVCIACSKHIYTVNKDIHENEKVNDFITSYTPMPGYPVITNKLKVSNVENNITTNCPDCNGELTLYLAGRQIG